MIKVWVLVAHYGEYSDKADVVEGVYPGAKEAGEAAIVLAKTELDKYNKAATLDDWVLAKPWDDDDEEKYWLDVDKIVGQHDRWNCLHDLEAVAYEVDL